jgi:hypothetical protein
VSGPAGFFAPPPALARAVAAAVILAASPAIGWTQQPAPSATEAEAPMSPEARRHFDRGASLVIERRYAEASREFEAAHRLDPRKQSLFAWAQVERLRGNCARAIELYKQFLASGGLTPSQEEAADLNIRRCEREASANPAAEAGGAPAAAPSPAPAAPPVVVERTGPPAPPAVERSRAALALTAVLAGTGVASAGTAGVFYYLSVQDERRAREADLYDDYVVAIDRSRSRQRVAALLGGAGVLLGAGAVLQWLVSGRQAAAAPGATATAWLDGDGGGGVAFGGRF